MKKIEKCLTELPSIKVWFAEFGCPYVMLLISSAWAIFKGREKILAAVFCIQDMLEEKKQEV